MVLSGIIYNYKIYFKNLAAIQILKHTHKKHGKEYSEMTLVPPFSKLPGMLLGRLSSTECPNESSSHLGLSELLG